MIPEEKAKELVDKFQMHVSRNLHRKENAKACAILCCDEILESHSSAKKDSSLYKDRGSVELSNDDSIKYWQQVKEAINKM